MKNLLILTLLTLGFVQARAQESAGPKFHAGLELDALPYLTGGYFVALTAGKGLWRLRALTADVNKPDWTTTDGFANHHITAYALVVDRFLKPDWKGWWIGAGPVYWKSKIQTEEQVETAEFENWLLNGSLGYHFQFWKHFYVSPWAGLSLRIAGDQDFPVDNQMYTLPLFNPEASVKLGVYF